MGFFLSDSIHFSLSDNEDEQSASPAAHSKINLSEEWCRIEHWKVAKKTIRSCYKIIDKTIHLATGTGKLSVFPSKSCEMNKYVDGATREKCHRLAGQCIGSTNNIQSAEALVGQVQGEGVADRGNHGSRNLESAIHV